jgi:hypothetical protein
MWTTDCDIVILFVQSGFGAPKGARKVLESRLPAFDVKLGDVLLKKRQWLHLSCSYHTFTKP